MVTLALIFAAKGPCDAAALNQMLKTSGALDRPDVEVHVLGDSTTRLDPPLPEGVRLHLEAKPVSVFRLWGAGIARTSARYVAILDVQYVPTPDWLDTVLSRLEAQPTAFFGPVEPGYGAQDMRMIGYLTEYVQFHRPIAETMTEVAGANLVLLRALTGDPADLAAHGFVKTALLSQMQPELANDCLAIHHKALAHGPYQRRRFRHGRAYAAHRLTLPGAPPRLAAALFTPLLPFVRVARIYRHAQRVETCRAAFARFWPHLLWVEAGWSAGECFGYLTGRGGDERLID
ncbi:MAG: hypothetical protein ACREEY_03645 [Brevundimonas sp.]